MSKFIKIWSLLVAFCLIAVTARDFIENYYDEALNKTFLESDKAVTQQTTRHKTELLFKVYNNLKLYTGQEVLPLVVQKDSQINAWTDGERITFTTGILQFVSNEDEIANILAHEMAHEMLKHVQDDAQSSLSITDREAHADKLGVYLLMRAGYDICRGKEVWKKFQQKDSGDFADTEKAVHPSYSYRYYSEEMPWCNKN